MNKVVYTYENYKEDLHKITGIIKDNNIDSIVTMYRGGLILGTNLSYITNSTLSIIDYQSYDGNSEAPVLIKNTLSKDSNMLLIDDLIDTGNTMKLVTKYLDNLGYKYTVLTIYGYEKYTELGWQYLREKPDAWIEFFWEV